MLPPEPLPPLPVIGGGTSGGLGDGGVVGSGGTTIGSAPPVPPMRMSPAPSMSSPPKIKSSAPPGGNPTCAVSASPACGSLRTPASVWASSVASGFEPALVRIRVLIGWLGEYVARAAPRLDRPERNPATVGRGWQISERDTEELLDLVVC